MDAVWRMGEMHRLLTFFPLTGGAVRPLVPVIRVFLIRVDKTAETVSSKDEVTPTAPSPRSAVSTGGHLRIRHIRCRSRACLSPDTTS